MHGSGSSHALAISGIGPPGVSPLQAPTLFPTVVVPGRWPKSLLPCSGWPGHLPALGGQLDSSDMGMFLVTICSPPRYLVAVASGRCWEGLVLASSTEVLEDCGHARTGQGRVEMGGDGVVMEPQQARPGVSRRQPTKRGMIEQIRGRVPAKKDRGLCSEVEGEDGKKTQTAKGNFACEPASMFPFHSDGAFPSMKAAAHKGGLGSPSGSVTRAMTGVRSLHVRS